MTAKRSWSCLAFASSVALTIVTPGTAGPQDSASAPPALHTAFSFWTHPLQGSEGDISYTDNLKHMMTVTTPFSRWSCSRRPVTLDGRGNWDGEFICVDDRGELAVTVDAVCPPNKITPMEVQMMSVHETLDGHDIGIQFVAACLTGTDVPKRGEVKR